MSDHSTSNTATTSSSNQQQAAPSHHELEESTIFRSIPLRADTTTALPPALHALRPASLPKRPLGLAPLSAGKRMLDLPQQEPLAPLAAPPAQAQKHSLSWKVDAASIPAVPEYPLERTNVTCADLDVDQITERIARVLESQNLRCIVPNDKDSKQDDDDDMDEVVLPGRVDCSSTEGDLKFVVQLWRNHENQIVVEMQRRRGDALAFSAIRKPLFQVLQTGAVAAPKKAWSPPPFVPNKKFRVMPMSVLSSC